MYYYINPTVFRQFLADRNLTPKEFAYAIGGSIGHGYRSQAGDYSVQRHFREAIEERFAPLPPGFWVVREDCDRPRTLARQVRDLQAETAGLKNEVAELRTRLEALEAPDARRKRWA